MAEVKLTKTELRSQQAHLASLRKYLPTLQLKKAMLQLEVLEAKGELLAAETELLRLNIKEYEYLLQEPSPLDFREGAQVQEIKKRIENIAGVEVPYFVEASFKPLVYSLMDTPPWTESLILKLQAFESAKIKVSLCNEKKNALEHELKEVSIRVNLFEKILIPRAMGYIKKIKIFLGDQELAAVSRAKMAKAFYAH